MRSRRSWSSTMSHRPGDGRSHAVAVGQRDGSRRDGRGGARGARYGRRSDHHGRQPRDAQRRGGGARGGRAQPAALRRRDERLRRSLRRRRAREAGVAAFVAKPFSVEDMLEIVQGLDAPDTPSSTRSRGVWWAACRCPRSSCACAERWCSRRWRARAATRPRRRCSSAVSRQNLQNILTRGKRLKNALHDG